MGRVAERLGRSAQVARVLQDVAEPVMGLDEVGLEIDRLPVFGDGAGPVLRGAPGRTKGQVGRRGIGLELDCLRPSAVGTLKTAQPLLVLLLALALNVE